MDRLDFSQGIENALNTGMQGTGIRKTRDKPGVKESRNKGFSGILERSILDMPDLGPLPSINPSEEAMQNLLDAVLDSGDNLKRRPMQQEMLEFKKSVRNFLYYVVENNYEVRQSQGIKKNSRWDSKAIIYSQIRIIDQKLEELTAGVLLKQINNLDLNTRLEEITGLLVDLKVTGKITADR